MRILRIASWQLLFAIVLGLVSGFLQGSWGEGVRTGLIVFVVSTIVVVAYVENVSPPYPLTLPGTPPPGWTWFSLPTWCIFRLAKFLIRRPPPGTALDWPPYPLKHWHVRTSTLNRQFDFVFWVSGLSIIYFILVFVL